MITKTGATIEDLYQAPEHGKAELVDGKLMLVSPTGGKPGRAALRIVLSLSRHEDEHGGGYAIGDNVGFMVDLPNRRSFSPNAAWFVGDVDRMEFLDGAPRFAVEVRSEGDYGAPAERAITRKIRDRFAAGTLVVWDVDLLSEDVVRVHRASDPGRPTRYRRGELAEAEPAVPGWRMAVYELFGQRSAGYGSSRKSWHPERRLNQDYRDFRISRISRGAPDHPENPEIL
jgi:Uma2 family endonuclease